MLAHLLDISIRALVLALIGTAVVCFPRRKRAAMEHAVWTAVTVGMLALFVFGSAVPRLPVRVLRSEAVHSTQPAEVIQPAIVGTFAKPVATAPETPQPK